MEPTLRRTERQDPRQRVQERGARTSQSRSSAYRGATNRPGSETAGNVSLRVMILSAVFCHRLIVLFCVAFYSPYAPCLLGFEGHGGNRTPTIRGIVVHAHNADLLREASVEVVSKSIEDENQSRRRKIFLRWKKLLEGVLTKDRLEREYG